MTTHTRTMDPIVSVHTAAKSDRTAFITGGAGDIGRATAHELAARGLGVALFDLDRSRVKEVAAEIAGHGVPVLGWAGSVVAPDELQAAVEGTAARLGSVDVAVNAAGITGTNGPLWETTDNDWRRVVDVNLNGTFYACRAVVPLMRKSGWGRIVNVASVAGKEGNPGDAHYSSAKAGVLALTKSLGKELALDGVLVNAIAPATIETRILDGMETDAIEYRKAKIPMRRHGEPHEVAKLIAFLASDDVSFSTGAVYDISGGRAVY